MLFDNAIINSSNKSLKRKIKNKSFIVTSANLNSMVDSEFLACLENYEKKENSSLLIILNKNKKGENIPKVLQNKTLILNDVILNGNLKILAMLNNASSVDVTSCLPRLGLGGSSLIVGSPKQNLNYTPIGKNRYPHAIMSTGTISKKQYKNNGLNSKQLYLSDNDHVMGAIIVEIENDKYFHFRQVQYNSKTKSFNDLGYKYTSNSKEKVAPKALVLGDWHSGETDPTVAATLEDLSKKVGIKTWVLHDVFDGSSISHHELGNTVIGGRKGLNPKSLTLKEELNILSTDLTNMESFLDKIVIVKSNHDEFLDRYLQEGRYVFDKLNHRLSLELAIAMIDGKDPLKVGLDSITKHKKIMWLKRDDSFKVMDIELGAHGDKGANGARRGSPQAMEAAYGNCVIGHSHSPKIMRGVYIVGTSTDPFPHYGSGPTSWQQTSCIVYADGSRQLINVINGKVTTKKL